MNWRSRSLASNSKETLVNIIGGTNSIRLSRMFVLFSLSWCLSECYMLSNICCQSLKFFLFAVSGDRPCASTMPICAQIGFPCRPVVTQTSKPWTGGQAVFLVKTNMVPCFLRKGVRFSFPQVLLDGPFECLVVFSSSPLYLWRALIHDLWSTSVKEMDQNNNVMWFISTY